MARTSKKKKPETVMTITMPQDIREKLDRIAKKERRTKSAMIHYLIEQYQEDN